MAPVEVLMAPVEVLMAQTVMKQIVLAVKVAWLVTLLVVP